VTCRHLGGPVPALALAPWRKRRCQGTCVRALPQASVVMLMSAKGAGGLDLARSTSDLAVSISMVVLADLQFLTSGK
jgi:hypothetical protein